MAEPYVINLKKPEDSPQDIANKLNSLTSAINVEVIAGAVKKEDFDAYKRTTDKTVGGYEDRVQYNIKNGRKVMSNQSWSGAGLAKVTTDTTLTGDGTAISPLHANTLATGNFLTITAATATYLPLSVATATYLPLSVATATYAPLASPTFTGTVTAPIISNTAIASGFPQGFLVNGKIVTSVASNNLTVALKTLAGTDPSATDPVYVRIGNTVRSITAAKSVGPFSVGTNWFNAGSAELATKEIDYFVYLQWNTVGTSVDLQVSRIPSARVEGDFVNSGTNEKGVGGINNYTATDEVELIGRFNATLSAGAGYTWSIPATSIIINRPIFETRWLNIGNVLGFTSPPAYYYKISGSSVYILFDMSGTSNQTYITAILPIAPAQIAPDITESLTYDNGAAKATPGRGTVSGSTLTLYTDQGSTGWTATGTKISRGQFFYQI